MVSFSGTDDNMKTRQALIADLDVSMGGRAAEEIMYGEEYVTTGASNDFMQATQLATRMVTQFGMSESIGKVFYSEEDMKKLSPGMRNRINEEVKRLLDGSYARAKSLLNTHKEKLESLSSALLSNETLNVAAIKDTIGWKEQDVMSPMRSAMTSFEYQNVPNTSS